MSQTLSNSKFTNQQSQLNLDQFDPILQGGYQVVYDKEIPIQIRNQRNGNSMNEVGTLQNLRMRVLILPSQNLYSEIKVQITSETDLFFQFICTLDNQSFKIIKKQQSLNITFEQITQMIIKLMNLAHKQPNTHFAVLFITKEDHAHLDFIQNIEYKFIEVLSLNFVNADEDLNKQSVSYRFNLLKRKMNIVHNKLNEISTMIKVKNPSLLQQIQKTSSSQNSKKILSKTMKFKQ